MKRKGIISLGVLAIYCLLFGGCATELEEREFPTLLTISSEADFTKEWLNGLQEGTKKIDYNHLKVVLIERSFLENESDMQKMLTLLKDDKNIPLNAYVVTTEDLKEVTEAEETLEEPLGDYLEKLLEHGDSAKKETYPTIGMLYQEMENKKETLFIPSVSIVEKSPEVTSYEVYKRGNAIGQAESDIALLSFFIGNQLKEYVLELKTGNYVRLSNAENEIRLQIKRDESGLLKWEVLVEIDCDGKVLQQTYRAESEKQEDSLEEQIKAYMSKKALEALEQGIDVTNSFKKLGKEREWYVYYSQSPEFYEEDIEPVFVIDIDWIE